MCISTSWWVDKKLKIIYSYNGILLTNYNKLKQIPDICNHTYKTQKHIRDLIWVIPEWLNDFPYFNLSLNFAIRNPWSKQQSVPGLVFFFWLYTSPSLTAKNIINMISIFINQSCLCVKSSLGLLEKGVGHDQWVLLTELLAFVLLNFVLQGQTCLLFQVSLHFLLLHSNPLWWKGHLFLMLVLEGVVGLHWTSKLQLLCHQWLGHRLVLL